jgi:hypothetical protein
MQPRKAQSNYKVFMTLLVALSVVTWTKSIHSGFTPQKFFFIVYDLETLDH